MPDMKDIESKQLAEQLGDLCIVEVRPDGHCLYRAVSEQLVYRGNHLNHTVRVS
jgi:hypothetical protein